MFIAACRYHRHDVCKYEGYNDTECDPQADLEDYGPNTFSIRDTEQTIAFFNRLLLDYEE